MNSYLHRVVGLYPSLVEANLARDLIIASGMDSAQVRALTADSAKTGADTGSDSDDVLKDLLRDGAIGTAPSLPGRFKLERSS